MNTQPTSTRRELASRSGDGLDITLFWARRDGKDEVVVSVTDHREGESFEIPADPAHALDVYHHPFAYRDLSALDDEVSSTAA
jgi:hypothetical protein